MVGATAAAGVPKRGFPETLPRTLQKLRQSEKDLQEQPKGEPSKLAMAARLRREATLTFREIAQRLHMGSWRSPDNKLHLLNKTTPKK